MTVYVYSLDNPEVNNPYSTEDYGSISSASTSSEDIGLVSDGNPSFNFLEDDWYNITVSESLIPYGSLGTVSSSQESITYQYISSGILFTFTPQTLTENVVFTWVGNGTVFEIGNGLERTVNAYLSSGTLRVDSTVAETVLESVTLNPTENTILYSINGTYKDLQFISNVPENTQLFNIFGTSVEKDIDSYSGLETLLLSDTAGESFVKGNYAGLGSLFSLDAAKERIIYDYSKSSIIGVISLSGSALYSPNYRLYIDGRATVRAAYTEFVSGSIILSNNESGVETYSVTYDYNESSIAEGALDYGLVSNTEELLVDYGSLVNNGPTVDFGEISVLAPSIVGELIYPFGNINFVNGYSPQESYPWLPEPGVGKSWSFTKSNYITSGSLFVSGISSNQKIANYSYFGNKATLVISGELLHPFVDYTPHYGIEKNIGIGTTGIQISGTSLEKEVDSYVGLGTLILSTTSLEKEVDSYVGLGTLILSGVSLEKEVDSYVGLGTLTFSGTSLEKEVDSYVGLGTLILSGVSLESYSAQTPKNTQLFEIFGTSLEKEVDSYVGLGTLILSTTSLEKEVDSYVGLGTLTFSGTSLESYSAQTPENTQLFQLNGNGSYNLNREYKTTEVPAPITLSGELLHPFIDYTPHYGIEKNIGIGTTGIQYLRGVGFASDSEGNLRDARTYSNRYPINDKVPNTGIGTIKFDEINNTAKYSPLTPYTGTGLFDIISGYSPQESYPWLPEPGVGKSWSFTKSNYITSGSVFVSGISSTKEINVYGYYGDDNDPGTSGTIIISQQTSPIIERHVNSYIGNVTYNLSGTSVLVESRSYGGSGSVVLSGTSLEVYSAQTPENTQLFEISGTSLEVYSAQTPEIEVLYIISGSIIESKTSSYIGEGTLSLNGTARTTEISNYPTRGTIRFLRHNTDNDYDTCDSQEFTCDNLYSADVSFVANPAENIILFEISGISSTKNVSTYSYNGSGSYNFYGSLSDIRSTYFEVGFGTIFTISTVFESESEVYNGFGNLFALSGSSQSYSIQTPDSTVLVTISGSAISSIESQYSVVGIGLFNFFGFGDTKKVAVYSQFGSGIIDISGELVYPNIIFIPSPDGFGTINIIGSSDESIAKVCDDTSGSLFSFSSGLESFAKSTYIGIGTIYIQELSGSTVNNPFQISRTYVLII